jgi:hypothetical protein
LILGGVFAFLAAILLMHVFWLAADFKYDRLRLH